MKGQIFSKTIVLWLTASICCLLWGSAFPAIPIGYKLFSISSDDTMSIILFAGIRFFLAGILSLIIFSIVNKKLLTVKKSSLKKISVLSVFQTILQYVFFYLGLAFTTGERASVINGTSVFFALLISSLIFKFEKLNVRKVAGCLLGFTGIIIISLDGLASVKNISFMGELFILLSSLSYAFSSVFMKKYSENENPAALSSYQFIFGGAVMIIVALVFGGKINHITYQGILLILYLAFVSAAAYSLWSILLKYNDVSKVAVCGFMTPVFGFFLSSFFSSSASQIGFSAVLSLIFVVIGIIVVNIQSKRLLKK